MRDTLITGVGVASAVGWGREAFMHALYEGVSAFAVMQRQGRQHEGSAFIGAELREPVAELPPFARHASLVGRVALATVAEAWNDASLAQVAPERVGLIVGGSNLTPRELVNAAATYAGRPSFVSPRYAVSLWDTDVCGLCTEAFGIRALAFSLGGGAASGQLAVIHAAEAVRAGKLDACIAVGAMTDLSHIECQALRNVGAMGTDRYAADPDRASRPFDRGRDGFIYGEACGAVVVEAADSAASRRISAYGRILGYSTIIVGTREPKPDVAGEIAAIRAVLAEARLAAREIDYINPHGSGSIAGDRAELEALAACHLHHARINATKSITGHGLSAAGAVEVIATVLQMYHGELHPTLNLDDPEVTSFDWVRGRTPHAMRHALCLSYGFGGINTALCLAREGERAAA